MQLAERRWPGDADRPALALHCSLGASGYWAPISEHLGGVVDLLALDAPGHGRNPDWLPRAEGPDFHSAYTQAAAARIDAPVDLIGHSLGATVALRLAVDAPQRVRSLTLIEPVLFAATPVADRLQNGLVAMVAEGREAEALDAFLDIWGLGPHDALPPAAKARMIRQMHLVADSNKVLVEDRPGILRPGGLEAIAAPVMIIRGTDSPPIIADVVDAIAARLADVGRAVVPDAGHMLPISHPAQVADLTRLNLERA